jgi:hypothetical protein
MARALLLVPYTLASNSKIAEARTHWSAKDVSWLLGFLGAVATAKQVYVMRQAGLSPADVLLSLTSHPAVTTLGVDMFISVASWLCWQYMEAGANEQAGKTVKAS